MAARKKSAGRKAAAKKSAVKKSAAKKPARAKPSVERRHQPQNLRVKRVGLSVTVNDLQKSLDWYTRVLGFVAGDKWEQGGKLMAHEIKSGATGIWLNQDDWAKGRDRVKFLGTRVYFETEQDIFKLADVIKSRGGRLDHDPETREWGGTDFGITDPDGFKITIQSL